MMISGLRLLLAVFCVFPLVAAAADTLHWRCWHDQEVHITCIVDSVPDHDGPAAELGLPSNLPPIITTLRQNPGALRNRVLHIPLHTVPYDMEFTALLAKATVCGTRPECTVNFTAAPAPAEEIVALLNKNLPFLRPGRPEIMPTQLALLDDD